MILTRQHFCTIFADPIGRHSGGNPSRVLMDLEQHVAFRGVIKEVCIARTASEYQVRRNRPEPAVEPAEPVPLTIVTVVYYSETRETHYFSVWTPNGGPFRFSLVRSFNGSQEIITRDFPELPRGKFACWRPKADNNFGTFGISIDGGIVKTFHLPYEEPANV